MLEKRLRHWSGWPWIFAISIAGLLFWVTTYFWAEGLWFRDVGYGPVFRLRVWSQIGLGLGGALISLVALWGNLILTRTFFHSVPSSPVRAEKREYTQGLGLSALLLISFALAVLIGVQMVYLGRVVASSWNANASVYTTDTPLPLWAKPAAILEVLRQLGGSPWQLLGLLGVAIAFLFLPQFCTAISAVITSIAMGLILSEQWTKVLPALNPVPFGEQDPLFKNDLSYYLLRLPLLEIIEFWLISLVFFALVSVTLTYLLSGNSLSNGRFNAFTPAQQRHLYGLGGVLMLATSLNHWLARYEILYSRRGAVYGASFTDVYVTLPVYTALCMIALFLALALLWRTMFWSMGLRDWLLWLGKLGQRQHATIPLPYSPLTTRPLLWSVGIYLVLAISGGIIVPPLVQRLIVQPNELQRETPFLQRSIAFTRRAFDLADVNVQPFIPENNLTVDDLESNRQTLDNIRLWGSRPLLQSNRQLQQIRLYYEFSDADVDRYTLTAPDGETERRQVLISARELNYDRVPPEAQTWVNEHLVYTHGYGFTMSPVNTADADGLPTYFVRDIAHTASNAAVKQSIPVGQPRIYFGELTNTYVMTDTRVRELDYPSGDENVYTVYTGHSGISLQSAVRRLLFAFHLQDWQMLFTRDFTPETRLLFRRRITDRVQAIAPFLQFDTDPYLVVADIPEDTSTWGVKPTKTPQSTEKNYLYWIVDAYITSDRYPYSDPLDNDFNYIRNSVKVVVDAYNGEVKFYIADEQDPMIQTWSLWLPGMFYPLDTMPTALREHVRFPQDLFQIQSQHLMTYHMTDPQVFYNREDQWRAPNEIYGDEAQEVEPYYLIMRLPEEEQEEFILLRPFTPAQRNNLVAWLAASSDGDRYGQKLLYRFPKQELVFGPEQIEARINQDPAISQRISLWNTQGSRAQQGNLLVIPIERSLLYVEPLYLEAKQNSLPTLTRVILVFGNRIAMAENLGDALAAVFQRDREKDPPVLQDLNESAEPLQDLFPSLLDEEPTPPGTDGTSIRG
jgi:uncharacterized membrane protein (UPF0182 family)